MEKIQHFLLALKIIKRLREYKSGADKLYLWNEASGNVENYGILARNDTVGRCLTVIVEFTIKDYRGWFWRELIDEVVDDLIPDDKSKDVEVWAHQIEQEINNEPSEKVLDQFIEHLNVEHEVEPHKLAIRIKNGEEMVSLSQLYLYDMTKIEKNLDRYIRRNG